MSKPKLEILEPKALDTHVDAYMVCMHGTAGHAPVPSVNGQCDGCWRPIYWAITAPTGLCKFCAKCALARIQPTLEHRMAITETTIQETLQIEGLEDTPEVRAEIQHKVEESWLRFLHKQARLIDQEETKHGE